MLRLRLLHLFVVSIVAVGCGLDIGARTHQVTVPGGSLDGPLPVTLHDRTGWVTGVGLPPPGAFPGGAANPAAGPEQLVVTWLGGLCDEAASVTLETGPQETLRFLIRTDRPDGCLLAGVERTVRLDLDRPIAAERVTVVDMDLADGEP